MSVEEYGDEVDLLWIAMKTWLFPTDSLCTINNNFRNTPIFYMANWSNRNLHYKSSFFLGGHHSRLTYIHYIGPHWDTGPLGAHKYLLAGLVRPWRLDTTICRSPRSKESSTPDLSKNEPMLVLRKERQAVIHVCSSWRVRELPPTPGVLAWNHPWYM